MYWMFTLVIGMMIGQEVQMPLVRPLVVGALIKLKDVMTQQTTEQLDNPDNVEHAKTTVTELAKYAMSFFKKSD